MEYWLEVSGKMVMEQDDTQRVLLNLKTLLLKDPTIDLDCVVSIANSQFLAVSLLNGSHVMNAETIFFFRFASPVIVVEKSTVTEWLYVIFTRHFACLARIEDGVFDLCHNEIKHAPDTGIGENSTDLHVYVLLTEDERTRINRS